MRNLNLHKKNSYSTLIQSTRQLKTQWQTHGQMAQCPFWIQSSLQSQTEPRPISVYRKPTHTDQFLQRDSPSIPRQSY